MTSRKKKFNYDELISCAKGELFGVGNAQLPMPPMLMIDRVTEISDDGGEHKKGHVIAEFDINPKLWFFECHFEGDPVMPGCLGLDALWQLTGFNLGWREMKGRGRALGVGEVKFTSYLTSFIFGVTIPVNFTSPTPRALPLPFISLQPRLKPVSCHNASKPKHPGITGSPSK